jgi:short-subunit dehydrogenase
MAFENMGLAGKVALVCGGGGAIVNVASVSGLRAAPYHSAYGAAAR